MRGLHEARQVEIAADILDHDIGCVAPASDRDVAIGQGEPVERGRIGAFDDIEIGDRIGVEAIAREGAHPVEIAAQGRGVEILSGLGLVLQPRAQFGIAAGIDAQRSRTLRLVFEEIVADHFQQTLGPDGLCLCHGFGPGGGGASAQSERSRRAEACEGLTTGDFKALGCHGRGCARRALTCQLIEKSVRDLSRDIRAAPSRHAPPVRAWCACAARHCLPPSLRNPRGQARSRAPCGWQSRNRR